MCSFAKHLLLIIFCFWKDSKSIRNYSIKSTWYTTKLHEYPLLYFKLDFSATFSIDNCCPVMYFSTRNGLYTDGCFHPDIEKVNDKWYKNSLFFLNPLQTSETSNVECTINSDLNLNYCISKYIVDQEYTPMNHYIYLGYPCGKQKNGTHIDLQINMHEEKNETTCTETKDFSQFSSSIKCKDFYQFTSLPNAFGDTTQADANKAMEIFSIYFDYNRSKHCHKYVMKLLCTIFFPMCPSDENKRSNTTGHSDIMLSTDHLIPACRETVTEVVDACWDELEWLRGTATGYFPLSSSNKTCFYEPVTCPAPPDIENGRCLQNNTIFSAKDTVYYICDANFEMSSSINYSECSFSGFWTQTPLCEKPISNVSLASASTQENEINTSLMVTFVIIGGIIILAITVAGMMRSRKLTKEEFNLQTNLNLVSRNQIYDAFLSYESGDVDEQFVRNEICIKLDLEYGGKFKLLIHQRDFKAGVLIMASIQNAVRNSNCALILLSQTYIKSKWCQQEFEECMEENKKDPNYRIIVILMQPLAILEQEKLTPYMITFLRSKTYLELDDSKLWTKLEEILEKHKSPETIQTESEL